MTANQTIFALAAVLGAIGMWLLLPRAGRRSSVLAAGLLCATVSLGMFVSQVPRLGDWIADGVFFVLAGVTIVSAVATITLRNPIYSAMWFGLSLLGTAGLFLFQGAQFLAVATVVVYAGAILVTFLFVLMLAQPKGHASYDRTSWEAMLSALCGAVIVGLLTMTVTGVLVEYGPPGEERNISEADRAARVLSDQHVAHLGAELFGPHLIAVEVAGTLLLAALVGAAVIVGPMRKRNPQRDPPSDTLMQVSDRNNS